MAVEAAISSTVQLLGTLLITKVDFLQHVEEEVGLLRDELNRMLCFLKDANNKQAQDERVRNWISEIREVAHDAKDAIELFVNKLESKGRLGKLSYYPKHLHYINKAGKEIASIQKRLNAIHRSRELYGIRDLGAEASAAEAWRPQVESRRRLCPWKKKEHVVGMEEDERKLLRESVLDKEKEGLMISVVEGMGGIGKSTLAMKIYNHGDVVAGFDCRGWVVVSSEFKPQEMTKQLILQLARSDEEKKKVRELESSNKDMSYLLEKLQEMLHRQLKGKKYFIVLDDVWEKEHWECIRSAFPDEQDKTSRLLITTRNKVIAKHGQYALEMNLLDLNKSWELFLKKALIHNGDGGCPQELEQIGKTIVEKCNGLPLAISVAGGLLLETQTKSGWEEVLNQINSHSGTAENSVSTILELSYQNLSPKLKSCFLSLACFKEDTAIPTKSILHIWLGQGLIEINEGSSRTVEEIARGYLDELINRNMVQIKDLTLDDRAKNCYLHDLLHDLCLVKAKEEMGFQIMKQLKEEMIASKSSSKTRHLVVQGENIKTLSLDKSNHLRSIFVLNSHGGFGHYMTTSFRFWKHFKMLGTLYLDGIGLENFPRSFRSLISLKYLRINCGSHEPLKLPSWLDYLTKLEVLDTRSEEVELPYGELKMEKLRYFSALHIHGLKRMDNWKNIESLKYIKVDDFLQCSSRQTLDVREFGMFLEGSRQPDELTKVRASLEKMENLVKLKLVWNMPLDIEPMIPGRLNNLTRLKLRGGMRSCVDASVFPPNLSHLTLVESFVDEDLMAELGKLPKLLYLKLSDHAYLGCTMEVLHDGFSCLVALSLRRMYFLERINIRDGGMPHLRHLRIHCCPALKTKWCVVLHQKYPAVNRYAHTAQTAASKIVSQGIGENFSNLKPARTTKF